MASMPSIRRALLSVFDKTGLVEFARALHGEFGIELISTGGTARVLTEAEIPVTLVEQVTGFPEMMDGRVKTLHPRIHAAILADRDNPEHMRQLAEQGIEPIDMVVVNLYPFEKTIADPHCTFEQAIEMIDIGGPCLLRAAAKNHRHVLVVPSPVHYSAVLERLRDWDDASARADLLRAGGFAAFWSTCGYDGSIAQWLGDRTPDGIPLFRVQRLASRGITRYGENPHQRGEILEITGDASEFSLADADAHFRDQPPLSFNNYVDASAALELCADLTRAASQPWNQPPTGEPSMWHQPPTKESSMWHQPPTGEPSMWHRFSTGGAPHKPQPASGPETTRGVDTPVSDERLTRRNLPHIQRPEATYFVTFRLRKGQLAPAERDIVLSACTYWHGSKMTLHCAVVMPDHVHLLLTPHEAAPGRWVPLGDILHSIKRYTARQINKSRKRRGSLWMDETFDRLVRDQREFIEKWDYIEHNPVTAGLVPDLPYKWFWKSEAGFMERIPTGPPGDRTGSGASTQNQCRGTSITKHSHRFHRLQTGVTGEGHRLETGATGGGHRLETGATGEGHRLETGATGEGHRLETGATGEGHRLETGATGQGHQLETGATGQDHRLEDDVTPEKKALPAVCCFIKHTNACGAAAVPAASASPGDTLTAQLESYRRAYLGDPNAAMGGILAVNFAVSADFATAVMETYQRWGKPLKQAGEPFAPGAFFIEVWIAPSFEPDAVRIIRGDAEPTAALPTPPRKAWGRRVRLLEVGDMAVAPDPGEQDLKRIAGAVLMQTRDLVGLDERQWRVVTKRAPTAAEMDDLRFAWLVCKHTKSNAITICRDGMLLGSGAGQMSRVMSCRIATWLARDNGHADRLSGSVAASDAFFPFRDGPDILADAGVRAIIQPGGSKRDQDTIEACDAHGIAMIFTGTRHFKH